MAVFDEEGTTAKVDVVCAECYRYLTNSWISEVGGSRLVWVCNHCNIEYPWEPYVVWNDHMTFGDNEYKFLRSGTRS